MQRESHQVGQRSGDFVRLIETAFDKTGFSQWYGNEDVRRLPVVGGGLSGDGSVEQFAHQGRQGKLMREFELVNQQVEWRYVVGCHNGGVEGRVGGKTGAAQVGVTGCVACRDVMAAASATRHGIIQILSRAVVADSVRAGRMAQDTGIGNLVGKTGKTCQAVHIISHHFAIGNMCASLWNRWLCRSCYGAFFIILQKQNCMPIDLPKVRLLFEKANKTADVRFLTREIADRMRERLSVMKIEPVDILDAGCGDGDDMDALAHIFGNARIYGLDAACTRVRRAAGYAGIADISVGGVCCGDFGCLPFPPETFDMVWSNLALHWRDDHARVFREWRQVLRDDGLLVFSCFGEKTLGLLQKAYGDVDACSHVLPFRSMQAIGDDMVGAGFSAPVLEREWITVTYTETGRLLSDVRALGGNPLSCRPAGLSGKRAYRRFLDALEAERTDDGILSLTFEVIYAHAFREPLAQDDTGRMIRLFRE